MYIEFIGTPGAGKTTVTEKTARVLKEDKFNCTTRENFFGQEQKRIHKALWSLLHLRYIDLRALVLWLRLSRRRNMGFEKTLIRIHEYQKLRYQLTNRKDTAIVLWDNGFIQWFSNHVVAGLMGKEAMTDFIQKRIPARTLLVFIDTPVEQAIRRMREREVRLRATIGTTMQEKSAAEEEKEGEAFAQSRHIQKNILEELAKRNLTTLTLDGTRLPEENAMVVYKK